MFWVTHFGDDERLAVLEPSFQREAPRRAPAQLDLDVVEGDELLHRLHSPPLSLPVAFRSPLGSPGLLLLTRPAAVPPLLHLRSDNNGWTAG